VTNIVVIGYFNIIQGSSNGLELLNIFDDALQIDRAVRGAALEPGDVVVMDNYGHYGFHDGRHIEPLLGNMFNR